MRRLPFLLIIALINSCIELEISAPSFPSIMAYFSVSEAIVGYTIALNMLGFCLAALCYGPLSDTYGRRVVMVVGNAILVIGAVGCVFAPNIFFLLTMRFIQGLGAATSAVVVSAIIADTYSEGKAATLYGVMNAIFTLLMALSPLVGAYLQSQLGWRGNYGVVALISFCAWILLLLYLPESYQSRQSNSLRTLLRLNQRLLCHRFFIMTAIFPSLLYAGYLSFMLIAPFVYINVFSQDMKAYVCHISSMILCFAIFSSFAGKIMNIVGNTKTLLLSLCLIFSGGLLMFVHNLSTLTLSMCLYSIGFALSYPIIFSRSMTIFPDHKGAASSCIMSLRYLICALCATAMSTYYQGNLGHFQTMMSGLMLTIVFMGLYLQKLMGLQVASTYKA